MTAQGTSVFDGLLAQCRDLFCAQLDHALSGMLEKSDEALSELTVKTQDREAQKLYLQVKETARLKRVEFQKLFSARYLTEFNARSNRARKIGGSFADIDFSTMELSLVADDDLDEALRFNEMAARLRRICEEEINALDQRVGVLVGDAEMPPEDNPFSPQAICDAYKQACRQLDADVEVRKVLLRLFDDHVLDQVRAIYKDVNDLLVQNAILPKIRYGAPRKDPAKKRKVKGKDGVETEVDEPAAEDMFAALQKLLAAAGGGGAGGGPGGGGGPGTGVGGGPLLQGTELIGSLTQLQLDGLAALGAGATLPSGAAATPTTNILHELKGSSVGSSMGQMDAMTLDIVARLFDQLFDDPNIPLGAKGLIGRLQIPMLKVAIADKDFFSKKDHPARLLLDTLGETALRLPADFHAGSPLYGHLETILQELITGFKDDVEIFTVVREQLDALMRSEDERVEQEAQAASERIIQEEALAVAKSVAQQEVGARVQAQPLPGPVLEFLIEQWLKLMMLIHVKRGAGSEPWERAIEAMDQLVWSVQPKESVEERRKLAMMVPPLLKRLTAGLQAAGIDDSVREQFFADLMRFHTAVLSAPVKGAAPEPKADAPASPQAPAFNPSITIRNPFGGGTVQVREDDAAPEDPQQYGRGARGAGYPDGLRQGDWVEFHEPGKEERQPVRLIFISPRKTRYIFADRGEKTYIECTRAEITRRFRNGEAVVMEEVPEVPFFERIMGGVISKMKGAAA